MKLKKEDKFWGIVGTKADFSDVLGNELFVGDIVELFSIGENEVRGKRIICFGDTKSCPGIAFFVMGVSASEFVDGLSTDGNWKITKVKSFSEFKLGDEIPNQIFSPMKFVGDMKLYLLTQTEKTGCGTYDSCVVCANDEEDAKTITPYGDWKVAWSRGWASFPENVTAKYLGEADDILKRGIVCASFRAG